MPFALAPRNLDNLRYTGENFYILPAIEMPRAPLPTDIAYPTFTIVRNANKNAVYPDAEGDMWILTRFNKVGASLQAVWNKLSPGNFEGLQSLSDTAGTVVNASAFGNVQLRGGPGVSIVSDPEFSAIDISLVGGGTAVDQILPEAGITPVVADENGQIAVIGTTQIAVDLGVAPNGIRTTGVSTNVLGLAMQQAGQTESINTNNNGIAHFQGGSFFVQGGFVRAAPQPGVENLGVVYNSSNGLFNFRALYAHDLEDLDPSLEQPGIFNVPIGGLIVATSVIENQSFTDANGTSTIVGNLFGFQNTDVVNVDIPFYIYGVMSSALSEVSFMISRIPGMTVSPDLANIGFTGSVTANNQHSFFALDPLPDAIANFVSQPCFCIGAFRMRLAAGGNWTVQPFTTEDGIGNFHENTIFSLPTGVLGASTNTHWAPNGGTAPVFTTRNLSYMISRNGYVNVAYQGQTITTDGVGAVSATLVLPFKGPANVINAMAAKGYYGLTAGTKFFAFGNVLSTQAAAQFVDSNTVVQNADLVAPVDIASLNVYYKPAIS